jgi:GNAT superfamily N-acetyltransferase
MATVSLRVALPEDAAHIAPIHRACWHQAYTGLVPQRCLDELDLMDLVAVWRSRLEQPEPCTTVALIDGQVIGMATVAPLEEAASLPPEELRAMYVLGTMWGQGIGRLLLKHVLAERPAALWVFEGNTRARIFYAETGWLPTGEVRLHDWAAIPEIRLVRDGSQENE